MHITNVIATSGRSDLLMRTLISLRSCRKPEGYKGVIVIENGTEKKVEKLVSEFKVDFPLKYIHIDEASKSLALNRALFEISDGLVHFIDDDVRLEENTLIAFSEAASSLKGEFFLGGPLSLEYEVPPEEEWKFELPVSSITEVFEPVFLGANFAASAECVRKVGGFRIEFGPNEVADGEDFFIQKALLGSGVKGYYVPGAKVWHYVSAKELSFRAKIKKQFRSGFSWTVYSKLNFLQKARRLMGCLFRSGRDVILLSWYVVIGNKSKTSRVMSELVNCFGIFYGIFFGRKRLKRKQQDK